MKKGIYFVLVLVYFIFSSRASSSYGISNSIAEKAGVDIFLTNDTIFYGKDVLIQSHDSLYHYYDYTGYPKWLLSEYHVVLLNDSTFIKHGTSISYNRNGEVSAIKNYLNDTLEGSHTRYKNGKMYLFESYKKGVLNGFYYTFNDSFNVTSKGKYAKGERIGRWYYYYNSGEIMAKGRHLGRSKVLYYSKAVVDSLESSGEDMTDWVFPSVIHLKDGFWEYFNEKGEIERKEWYIDGKLERKED